MGRYQMVARRSLPRFGGKGAAEAFVSSSGDLSGAAGIGNDHPSKSTVEHPYQRSTFSGCSTPSAVVKRQPTDGQPRSGAGGGASWSRRVRWLLARVFRRRNPFNDIEAGVRASELSDRQPSLRLDTVHVVRNDLTDSDFEVVKASTRSSRRGLLGSVNSKIEPALRLEFTRSVSPQPAADAVAVAQSGGRGA